jgi:putative oxidoreductase
MTMSTLTTTASQLESPLRRAVSALVSTDGQIAPAIARVALGGVMLPHGLQKTLGLFGGYGFEGTMGFFTETVGLPWLVGFLAIMAESVGALALIAGVGGRLAALGIAGVMVGAIITTHLPYGFFMDWYGQRGGEGFEYHLLALALAGIVIVAGSGRASVDRWLSSSRELTNHPKAAR